MAIPLSILVPLYALGCFIFYRILASFLRTHHNARRARELKCLPPPNMKTKLPFGVDLVQRALAADKAKEFPVEMQRRMEEVGALTYYYGALGSRNIFTADEKNIQALLATQFKDFDLGPKRRRNFLPLLGNGIFTQDGSAWEHSRAMMRPQFARDQVSDLDLEEQHVQNLMRAIVPRGDGWTDTLDLQVLFFRLTLDSATEFLFGESVDSQLAALPGYDKAASLDPTKDEKVFAQAFDKGQMYLATRSRLQGNYWLYHPRDFDKVCGECHAFIDRFVRLALSKNLPEKGSAGATKTGEKTGAKEKYVFLDALAAETRDPVELRSQMLNILLAGRDTTASLIGWVFYCLARDPARYAKLRTIVVEQFGTFSAPREITFAKLKACQYLQHVNSEALRLYPVVPVNSRMANRDTTLPRGGGPDGKSPVFVPKGTPCDYSVYVMHRRKDIWGPDAELFVPERWEKRKVGWDFLPFNGGPRICIGQQFALTEASYVIVRLLQRFDAMQNMDPDHIVQHNLTLTSCSGAGVKVKLHAAAE